MKAIPEGWVAISTYDTRPPGADEVGPTGDYARILHALKLKPCPIQAYRDGRSWVARQADIEEFLAARKASSPSTSKAGGKAPSDLQYESVCESLADIAQSLAAVERLLGRLADAAEQIATQPKEPSGSWRDMNGEVMN
jgi:hypothetical protein